MSRPASAWRRPSRGVSVAVGPRHVSRVSPARWHGKPFRLSRLRAALWSRDHKDVPVKKFPTPPKNVRRPPPKVRPDDSLNAKNRQFVAEYLVDRNATQAAIRAGYSQKTAAQIGFKLLRKAQIASAIREGLEKLLSQPLSEAKAVIAEAERIAHSDVRKLYAPDGGLVNGKDIPDELAPAVSSVKETRRTKGKGETEVVREFRLWDKNAALNLLGRHHKILTEKIEQSHTHELKPNLEHLLTPDQVKAEMLRFARETLAKYGGESGD